MVATVRLIRLAFGAVLTTELLDPPGGIDEALLTREERVGVGGDVEADHVVLDAVDISFLVAGLGGA